MFHTIKQLEERNVANEISHMVWSNRMDLVAYSTVKGEVALHRLTWTRAWNLAPSVEGLTVKDIAWRPDGKILAIAYSNGEVLLLSIENKIVLNTIKISGVITGIFWVQEKIDTKSKNIIHSTIEEEDPTNYMQYIDFSATYLPEPPLLSSFDTALNSSDENKKSNILHDQSELNLLLIGTTHGLIHINIFGCFSCATLNIGDYLGYPCSIENIHLTEDLSKMFITVRDKANNIKIVLIDSSILKTHTQELFAMALKCIKLTHLITYLSSTITSITETWENILLEMDNKLSKYATKTAEGGVTADFLDLLMFGICSPEMEEFLKVDLTKKGLEKFGQSIEMSYSNIQKMLMKYVTKYGQNVTYHLAELRGMARLEHRYKVTGLSEDRISKAIEASGSFLIKAGEMQQIINQSIINYKAFFRWLYTAIMNLMEEQIPQDIPKMTQQDLAYITEFFQNFDQLGCKDSENPKRFIMERVGQYLSENSLTIPAKMEENEWTPFLAQNECLQNHPTILKHFSDYSLVQQFKHLKESINNIFIQPNDPIGKEFRTLHIFKCYNLNDNEFRMSQVNLNKDSSLFVFMKPPENIYLLQILLKNDSYEGRCNQFHFMQLLLSNQDNPPLKICQIMDVKFYSPSILSMLLQDTVHRTSLLFQFSIQAALENLSAVNVQKEIFSNDILLSVNGSDLGPKLYKHVEMVATQFAVSGSRKVSILLSENKRKVKLFEMEGDEEDDEDADMSMNNSRDQDISMQEGIRT